MKRMLGCSLCMRWGARALSGDDPSWDNVIAWGGGSIGATKKPLLAGEMMSEEEFLNMAQYFIVFIYVHAMDDRLGARGEEVGHVLTM